MDDQEDGEKRERVLLRPWLENLIESGSIPGLEWMDDGKTMFKVPWKHRSKKTWSLRHSSIFLEWAKNTGRWSEGDLDPNYAQLKTRLRCAFNKAPDIEEMREFHRTKAEEPYKVYKFIPRKESKLYPFGRRPLRKTTVPITVRRRRYFISRAASTFFGVSGGRRAVLSDSSSIRIKEEKENVANSSYKEMTTEENFNEPVINQNWKNWLPDQNERSDGSQRSSWPLSYEEEVKEQINRILPLIVEEANTNSMDLELPALKDKEEVDYKGSSSILPEIKDQTDSVRRSVDIPQQVLEKFQVDKEEARNKEVFASASLSPEKLEYLHDWHRNSFTAYDLNAANRRPPAASSANLIFSNGACSILPQLNEKINHADSATLCSSSIAPTCWPRSGLDVKLKMRSRSPDHFVPERRSAHDSEIVGPHKSDSVPAARLLPLKKTYSASQNVFDVDKSSTNSHSIVQKGRMNAVEKPSVAAQPRVAVAAPYDSRATEESGQQQFTTELDPGDLIKDAVKHKVHLPELEVIDLSAKVSVDETQNSESRVLDLTKKMVVTPFERGCDVWKSATKSCFPEAEKDIYENTVPSDPSSTIGEFMKFKSEYKRKKQLIVTKMMLLVEKEKELKAREKQLAAREEALFWKETYLHRVLSGLDYNSLVSSFRSGSTTPFAPSFETSGGSMKLIGSPELKEAHRKNCAPPALTLFTHQCSPVLMPGGAAERVQQPLAAVPLIQPEHLNLGPGFHVGSRDAKDGFPSSSATSAASSADPHRVPIGAARPISCEDLKMTPRASVLLPGDQVKYDGGVGLHHSELESDVALGNDYPLRKSYSHAVKKFQQEAAPLSLPAAHGTPGQPLMTTRKRGRPKGSKNKVKPVRAVDATSPLTRQMPPLLVIHPSGMNDAIIPTPNVQLSVPFHFARNENLSEIIADHCEYKENSAARAYSDKGLHVAAYGPRSYETDRILPPVTKTARFSSSPATLPASEATTSNHLPRNHAALFDNLPNKDVIPDAVRQLLVSASRPVGSILPPLSPAKSPDGSSPKARAALIYHHDEKFCEEEKVVTSVC